MFASKVLKDQLIKYKSFNIICLKDQLIKNYPFQKKYINIPLSKIKLGFIFLSRFVFSWHLYVSSPRTLFSDFSSLTYKEKQLARQFTVMFQTVLFKYRFLSFPADKAQRLQERRWELGLHNPDTGWVLLFFSFISLSFFFYFFLSVLCTCNFITYIPRVSRHAFQ